MKDKKENEIARKLLKAVVRRKLGNGMSLNKKIARREMVELSEEIGVPVKKIRKILKELILEIIDEAF